MNNLQQLQEHLNRTPCPYCGGMHRVDFLPVVRFGKTIVQYKVSDDACEAFRNYAEKAAEKAQRCDEFPFPLP